MSWDPELDELMVDTVEVRTPTVNVGFQGGEHSYSGTSYDGCRVRIKTMEVVKANGETIKVEGLVRFNRVVTIDPRARIVLPARYGSREMPVAAVAIPPDEDGAHHTVVYF